MNAHERFESKQRSVICLSKILATRAWLYDPAGAHNVDKSRNRRSKENDATTISLHPTLADTGSSLSLVRLPNSLIQ